MRKAAVLFVAIALICSATPCFADSSGMVLYDGFKKPFINASKWVGQENESDSNHRVIRESVRQIEGQQLHLAVRSCGTCNECGNTGSKWGMTRLKARNLQNATALKATVKVNRAEVVGSTVNTSTPAMARARLLGFFFNGSLNPVADDDTGDVYAYIGLIKASDSTLPANRLDIRGYVIQCNNKGCTDFNELATPVNLGTAKIGQPITLFVEWDQANKKFIFQRIKGNKVKNTQEIAYTLGDTTPPMANLGNKRVDVVSTVPNDASGAIPTAFMDANFDDFYYK